MENNSAFTVTEPNIDETALSNQLEQVAQSNNAFNESQAQKQRDWTEKMNQIAMDFNSAEAKKNRDWQTEMSNTQIQRRVEDAVRSGINPIYAIMGGSGATVGSGSSASATSNGSGSSATADTSIVGGLVTLMSKVIDANLNTSIANAQNAVTMRGQDKSLEGVKYSADQGLKGSYAIAGATMYAANINKEINERNLNQQRCITAQNNMLSLVQDFSSTYQKLTQKEIGVSAKGEVNGIWVKASGGIDANTKRAITEFKSSNPLAMTYFQSIMKDMSLTESERTLARNMVEVLSQA